MARSARIVIPGAAHHVVQRANRANSLFLADEDRRRYLDLLAQYAAMHRLQVYAWCLMPDHVHLVVVPEQPDSLASTMKSLKTQFSKYLRQTHRKPGLLRGRFASCPMDEPHMWEAVRYVERNPLRAGKILRPDRYPWSSAGGHVGLRKDPLVSGALESRGKVKNWVEWLRAGEDAAMVETIRACTRTGRPAGDEVFVSRVKKITGRTVRAKKGGRRYSARRAET
jgi:putative transposase